MLMILLFVGCVSSRSQILPVITSYFHPGSVLTFIYENRTDFSPVLPDLINQRILVESASLKKFRWKPAPSDFVFFFDGNGRNFPAILDELKSSLSWNPGESPRARFLVFVEGSEQLRFVFETSWRNSIRNIVAVTRDLRIYTYDPFTKSSNCGRVIEPVPVTRGFLMNWKDDIKHVGRCGMNFIQGALLTNNFHDAPIPHIQYRFIKLIGRVLKTNVSQKVIKKWYKSNENGTELDIDIVFYSVFSLKLYHTYDVCISIFQDNSILIVPKALPTSSAWVLLYLFDKIVWFMLFISAACVLTTWFLIVKFVPEENSFETFFACLMTILKVSLGGGSDHIPTSNILKFILLLYLVFTLEINTAFQGKLISLLTRPMFDKEIDTVNQVTLAKLGYVTSKPVVDLYKSEPWFDALDKESVNRITLVEGKWNASKIIDGIILYRNFTTSMFSIAMKWYFKQQSKLHLIYGPELPVVDILIVLRKGHYLTKTMNKIITKLTEAGLFEQIIKEVVPFSGKVTAEEYNAEIILTVKHLYGVFLCWGAGLTVSLIAFLAELINTKIKKEMHRLC